MIPLLINARRSKAAIAYKSSKSFRFFFTHKESGLKMEKGWPMDERQNTKIHSRKLSDIICDNMEFESIPENIFDAGSKLMSCNARTKLSLSQIQHQDFQQTEKGTYCQALS